MEDAPSSATPPTGRTPPVPAIPRRDGAAEGSATEGLPLGLGLLGAGLQEGELLFRRDKDIVEDSRLERRDTAGSAASDFGPPGRSDSGWSTAPSTATDMTELDPGSPDLAFVDDDAADIDAEIYASSPRRSGLFPFAKMPFQKRLPFRPAPICGESDKPLSPLRHRRLGEMAPRKSSLSISSGPNASDADSEPGPSSSRGEPSPLSAREPCIAQPDAQLDNDDSTAGPHSDSGDLTTCGAPDSSPLAALAAPDDATEGWQTPKQEPEGGGGWEAETPADTDMEDDAQTPGKASTIAADTPCVSETAASPRSPTTPEERPTPLGGEESDWSDGGGSQPMPDIDDGMIQEVCKQVLRQAFGLQFELVAHAGVASAVHDSVSFCLDELSHILLNSGLSHTRIEVNEATRGTTAHSAVSILPAGGTADRTGGRGRGGGGGDDGNGEGSRKRSSGGHDDCAGPGDGDGSPGGRKRQRVSQKAGICYSCPFRKRNPLKFNVREFRACAFVSFTDFTLLKRHVKQSHENKGISGFVCPRCHKDMQTQEALTAHSSGANGWGCKPRPGPPRADPEDGIRKPIIDMLNDRKTDGKIGDWESLWRILFPDDVKIPKPDFISPTELDEVDAQFKEGQSMGQLRRLLNESLGPVDNTEKMVSVFTHHMDSVFNACQEKTGGVVGTRQQTGGQESRQATSRQSSVRHRPGVQTLTSQGSGTSNSSASSLTTTPGSSTNGRELVVALRLDSQQSLLYREMGGGYPGPGTNSIGEQTMPPVPGGGSETLEGAQPRPPTMGRPMAPPELWAASHLAHPSVAFDFPSPSMTHASSRQRGLDHTPRMPSNGLEGGLQDGFGPPMHPEPVFAIPSMVQGAADYSCFPATFSPHNGHPLPGSEPQITFHAQHPPPKGTHGATGASVALPINLMYTATHHQHSWQGSPSGQ